MKRMSLRSEWLMLIFTCLCFFPLKLAAADTRSLTISDAIQLADKQNPKIKAALSQVTAADQRITQAESGFLPQVFFTETYSNTNNPMWAFGNRLNQEIITQPDFNPDRLNHPDSISNFNSALSMEWSVYQGGQTRIGVNQAKLDREAQDFFLKRTRQEVIATAATAYAGMVLAYHHLDVIQKSLETARVHLEMIRKRYENGLAVKSDLLRTQVHIAELDQDRIQAESRISMALSALNAAMGVPGDSYWQLSTGLVKGEPVLGPIDEWIGMAQSHRPDMQYLQLQEKIAEDEVQKSRAAHLPNINLIGSYELNSPDFRNSGDSYTVGAMMRVNLYSGDRMSAKTRESEAMLSRIRAMRNDMAAGIEVQARQAFLQAQSAWNRIFVAEAAVSQSEEGLRIVRDRYENGLLTLVSLLDAEVALQSAQTNRYRSLHDYLAARIQLSLAAGTLDTNFQ
ncbi:MAG: TolC family protein [Deltaproteobacteria bacterium]|nr:TolC family protein [Deltaproteobacteria bacterium]